MKPVLIVGLNVREAEHHWRELLETRPELATQGRSKVASVESVIRGALRGRTPETTELIVQERAWRHPRAPYEFHRQVKTFESKASTIKNGDK